MKKASLLAVIAIVTIVIFCGCEEERQVTTGFLSDYSHLRGYSDQSFRYIPPGKLGNYSEFIIEPVVMKFYKSSTRSKVSSKDMAHLKQYMYSAAREAISDRYRIVSKPGPGVAKVRIAITDVKQSKTLQNLMPVTKLVGSGVGGASIEAEIVDSQTGVQVAAIIETLAGNNLSFDGLSKWGDTEAVMKDWASRFRKRLDEAH